MKRERTEYQKQYRTTNKTILAEKNHARYLKNKDKIATYKQRWQQEHRKHVNQKNREWYRAHHQSCLERGRKYYATHKESHRIVANRWKITHRNEYLAWAREYNKKKRATERRKVLEHYGLLCACCNESTYEFLGIDHINGGGTKHRNQIGKHNTYAWLIKNKFPKEFQTLCHNCNMAKGFYGQCPHQRNP